MNITRRIGVAGLLAFAALNLCAAPGSTASGSKSKFDVTGTWSATSEGGRGPAQKLVFVLKQDGDKLSGTVSTNGAAPVEISEARVLRTSIYFEVAMTMPAMPGGAGGAGGAGGPGGPGGPGGAGGPQGGPPGGAPGMGRGMGPGMGPGMGMGRSMVTKYSGKLSGDELKLESQMKQPARDGDAPTGAGMPKTELVAKRQ